ncbi:DUF4007 family protein [Acetobacterium bakii]|uniref:DUF4007 domain-containing protein n=1 Tax=Acetobacterium bakii TaxID=52689 RepID=A0A0L6TZN1_9FIRM|nr:DUF4007 family protein [Acetobacterium bakii]KNZ41724.1 hypothetical protein AKG39_10370 [Acetobacterium bakii]
MKFKGHETFYIRKGWLYKGLKNVKDQPTVFINKVENPMDVLGIGSNMVKSLRYWLQAVGLTKEAKARIREQSFTSLAEIIWENDRYLEEIGTLWLLHYSLATNKDNATAWYYFFNEFKLSEFQKEDFAQMLDNFVKIEYDSVVAKTSLEDDFTCIINTYVSRHKVNPDKVLPESNIDCPFGELGLIDLVDKKERIYRKAQPRKNMLHPLIVYAIILDQSDGKKQIRITDLLIEKCNVGKVLNLDVVSLTAYLYQIAQMGHIKVNRTAGLDVINILTDLDYLNCVKAYYDALI